MKRNVPLSRVSALISMAPLVLLAALAGFALVANPGRAQASHTRVFFAPAGRLAIEPIIGFMNGSQVGVDVRVGDMDYPTGLGAFEFTLTFNPGVATLAAVNPVIQGAFLGSTTREVQCTAPAIEAGLVNYSCNTIGPGAPLGTDGPLGSGVLATLNFQPGAAFGFTNLTFSRMDLDDVTGDIRIARTLAQGSLLVAKCGSFNGDTVVTIGDMVLLITRFGTFNGSANWDPRFDLNTDDRVTIGDMLIEVQEFGRQCTPA